VEWGVGRQVVELLTEHVRTRAGPPFAHQPRHRSVVWLEPRVVAEVTFYEFVNGWLRDAVVHQLVAKNFSEAVAVSHRGDARERRQVQRTSPAPVVRARGLQARPRAASASWRAVEL
jgi:hypothetical protein